MKSVITTLLCGFLLVWSLLACSQAPKTRHLNAPIRTVLVHNTTMPPAQTITMGAHWFAKFDPIELGSTAFEVKEFEVSGTDAFGHPCTGFISPEPVYRISIEHPPADALLFYHQFYMKARSYDTTMILLDPEGNLHCNDDHSPPGTSAGIRFDPLIEGDYFIWIGIKESNKFISSVLLGNSDPACKDHPCAYE